MKAFIAICLLSAVALASAARSGRLGSDANVGGRASAELRAGVDRMGPRGGPGFTASIGGNAGLTLGGTAGLGVRSHGYGAQGWGGAFGYPYGGYGGYSGGYGGYGAYDGGYGSLYNGGYYDANPSYGYGYGYPYGGYYNMPGYTGGYYYGNAGPNNAAYGYTGGNNGGFSGGSNGVYGYAPGGFGYTSYNAFPTTASTRSAGVTAFDGSAGLTGSNGLTGSTGFVGSNGLAGSAGFTGPTGLAGSAGFTGSNGLARSAGPNDAGRASPSATASRSS